MRSSRLASLVLAGVVAASFASASVGVMVGDEQPAPEVSASPSARLGRGRVVRIVAKCAPRGHDPRFETLDLKSHGAFIRAAARGRPVTVGGVEYPLTTIDEARALCAALDGMRTAGADAARKGRNKHRRGRGKDRPKRGGETPTTTEA